MDGEFEGFRGFGSELTEFGRFPASKARILASQTSIPDLDTFGGPGNRYQTEGFLEADLPSIPGPGNHRLWYFITNEVFWVPNRGSKLSSKSTEFGQISMNFR